MQVRATKLIKAGEEILAAYGGKWLGSQQQLAKIEAFQQQEQDQRLIGEQVYVHGGAAKRWHCIKCGKYLPKNLRRNHARLCQRVI